MAIEFKLILVVVDIERSNKVLDSVLSSGATGATILGHGRGVGLSKVVSFFGLELFSSRDVILVLVDSRHADSVLQSACEAGQLDETRGSGFALEIPVNRTVGLTEHIEIITREFPI
ncbi:MAG: hypothetical protein KF851_00850 [Pirellulaceae bacterium]|nr:hypothetical protein [Pirellulaceae bacterium]